jgi:hypothetical protein
MDRSRRAVLISSNAPISRSPEGIESECRCAMQWYRKTRCQTASSEMIIDVPVDPAPGGFSVDVDESVHDPEDSRDVLTLQATTLGWAATLEASKLRTWSPARDVARLRAT